MNKNEIKEIFDEGKGNRDPVFEFILSHLEISNGSVIAEVGSLRSLKPESRRSDGWGSIHFARELSRCGEGTLLSCDTNREATEKCREALENFRDSGYLFDFDVVEDDGGVFLSRLLDLSVKLDLVFLDGGDCGNEAFEQFEIAKKLTDNILVDDFHSKKGEQIKLDEGWFRLLLKFRGADHQMALFCKDENFDTSEITFDQVEGT
jgi:hypothetical protein